MRALSTLSVSFRGISYPWQLLGTFVISAALLSFEITSVRTINFTVGTGYIYYAIALAMLGLSSAGSILSLFDLRRARQRREYMLFWLCVAIALLIVLSHLATAEIKSELNDAVVRSGKTGGLVAIVHELSAHTFWGALRIGLSLSLPYFLFGAVLSILFTTTDRKVYGALYAADLIGAALGCFGAIVVMEADSYSLSVTTPALAALLAGSAFATPRNPRLFRGGLVATAALLACSMSFWYGRAIEPGADPNYLVRDYWHRDAVQESWHTWNSFTRVAAMEWIDGSHSEAILALANGEGMAWLPPYQRHREPPLRHPPTVPALLLDPPADALVLLAGAGADLMSLHEHGARHVVGVELNPTLVHGALSLAKYHLADFLTDPSVSLEIMEARDFLERDNRRYDVILVSWSGTTAAYYAGMIGTTTQFVYTYEGLAAILDHLKPGGYAIELQMNKVKVIGALRRYLAAHRIDHPERKVVVLFDPNDPDRRWDGVWDNNTLLIKPDGWTDAEVNRLSRGAAKEGWKVAYAPHRPVDPQYSVYQNELEATDIDKELVDLRAQTGKSFSIPTDDRPFFLDAFPTERYLNADFWRALGGHIPIAPHERYRLIAVIAVGVVSVLATTLILVPLSFRSGPPRTRRTFSHLYYFFCLGAGFMFLEIALMQKASLLFGNPGLTIAIVLAMIVLFSGLGSLASHWTTRRGVSTRLLAIGIFLYSLTLYFGLDALMHHALGRSVVVKAGLIAILIAPLGFLMGHMFPLGLIAARRQSLTLVPWAWGINGATSTVVAGLAPLLAQAWGFDLLILIGALSYGAAVLVPTTWQRRIPSRILRARGALAQ